MRRVLATGLALGLCYQLFIPVCASPMGGGIGQGFESGLGWGLCTAVGKGVVKAARAIRGRNHKDDAAQSTDNRKMGPEDYYNRGLEEGYARGREEGNRYGADSRYGEDDRYRNDSRYGADDRYQDRQDYKYADARDGNRNTRVEKRVYARRLAEAPASYGHHSTARRSGRKGQSKPGIGQSTIAGREKTGPKVANQLQNKGAHTGNTSKQKAIDLASKP